VYITARDVIKKVPVIMDPVLNGCGAVGLVKTYVYMDLF
jgi:hypothetical protein